MTRSFICRTLFRKPIRGWVRKIDEFGGALLLVGGEKIPISAVIGIQLYNDKEQIEEG